MMLNRLTSNSWIINKQQRFISDDALCLNFDSDYFWFTIWFPLPRMKIQFSHKGFWALNYVYLNTLLFVSHSKNLFYEMCCWHWNDILISQNSAFLVSSVLSGREGLETLWHVLEIRCEMFSQNIKTNFSQICNFFLSISI